MKKISITSIKQSLSEKDLNPHKLEVFLTGRGVGASSLLKYFTKLFHTDLKKNVKDYGEWEILNLKKGADKYIFDLQLNSEGVWRKRRDLGDVVYKIISEDLKLGGEEEIEEHNRLYGDGVRVDKDLVEFWRVNYNLKEL